MDKKLSNFLEKREHTFLTDIDVITAAVAVPLLEIYSGCDIHSSGELLDRTLFCSSS